MMADGKYGLDTLDCENGRFRHPIMSFCRDISANSNGLSQLPVEPRVHMRDKDSCPELSSEVAKVV